MTKPIRTQHLLDLIFNNPKKMFETRLLISMFFVGTHFMYFNGRNFYDEGIDGENRQLSRADFFKYYQNNYWLIDNVV
ncbi:MAG: hypothetical protein COU83_02785 [Candidatus Portnoybacteria bacterium CG10_big_fil_rev_8_21_14_0_10_40_22]|uniref:Uncharacterized protein n=2 Tax=Candidatus Portnoyibacteriota TaxID=1817913 RepID=A0A2M8KFE4_9BACT|nr:MAG: hypothetical protein COY09_01630 [Candidatus Portnoybacteria bacterium CG_4_10_14_0_2_um_filter_39_11]PJE58641.1 MAG: hypothetical protein COU83_02785 [Candidatus Portnoybacteria bacterium CG10_big_fil_rev_8_21_14_0_10_40_22]